MQSIYTLSLKQTKWIPRNCALVNLLNEMEIKLNHTFLVFNFSAFSIIKKDNHTSLNYANIIIKSICVKMLTLNELIAEVVYPLQATLYFKF